MQVFFFRFSCCCCCLFVCFSATSYLWRNLHCTQNWSRNLNSFCGLIFTWDWNKTGFSCRLAVQATTIICSPPCLPHYYEPIGPPWKCRPHSILGSWPQLWDSVPAPHCLKPVGLSVKTKDESSDWCNDFRYRQLSELG